MRCLLTSKTTYVTSLMGLLSLSMNLACTTTSPNSSSGRAQLVEGTIAYPFVERPNSLGRTRGQEKFVIRSAVGAAEYSVEIPDAGDGYDIQVPLAELNPPATSEALAVGAKGLKAPSPVSTDKELVNSLPSLAKANPNEIATMDAALGVGSPEGPIQSPSYTMGIAKVNQYYRERNYELALMELNNIISFYPNSPKLLKMKGTLLVKTGNQELAMKAWQRAIDLAPGDQTLGRAVKRLEERLLAAKAAKQPLPSPSLNEGEQLKPIPLDPAIEKMAH